jgi:hypothetical protein
LNTGAATGLAVTVRGASGQTGDLQQWQTSASAVLGGVSPIGQIYSGSTNPLPAYYQSSAGIVTAITYISATQATITNNNTSQVVSVGSWVVIGGVASNTTYNGTWLVTAIGGSSGAYTFTIQGSGFSNASTVLTSATYNLAGAASFQSLNSQTPAIITRAATGQNANLIEAQGAGGTALLFRVASSGGVTAASVTSNGGVVISGSSSPLTVGGTAGTSGQVLTSAGPGVSPTWSTVSSAPFGPRYLKSGYSYNPIGHLGSTFTTNGWTQNTLYAVPFYVPNTITTVYEYIYVSVLQGASGGIRFGIYSNSSTDDYPNARVVDAGIIATDTVNGTVGSNLLSINVSLTGGNLYWLVAVRQGVSNPTLSYITNPNNASSVFPSSTSPSWQGSQPVAWTMTGVSGALPATFSATKTLALTAPLVGIGF